MTLITNPASSASALAVVVYRVCNRAVPDASAVRVSDLTIGGGVRVWLEPATAPSPSNWVICHRLTRQLQLLGLHAEIERDLQGLVVLGWSLPFLKHRARQLRSALHHRLADFTTTARAAVVHAAQVHARHDAVGEASVVTETCDFIGEQLRWPGRLADLDGWHRHSDLPDLQIALAHIIGLEAKVAQACNEHLVYTRVLATSVCRHITAAGDHREAQHRVLAAAAPWLRASQMLAHSRQRKGDPLPLVPGGPPATLTERLIAVSVTPHSERAARWS
ncbi:hypothetical protein [Nonomuraea aridisoli]|uniref:hypothetical protein n=1 Tax=Nonomuraea aridisoli TaxID=2070368 RepID=UPI0015E8B58E|nr:hypothetical protein [Nonomuraea aridisoli]